MVGIAVPASFAERARAILGPLRDLFAATFFVAFGLATDPAAVLPVLPAVLALAVVTTVTKLGTGWFAARRGGVAAPGRLRVAALMADPPGPRCSGGGAAVSEPGCDLVAVVAR